MTKVAGRFHLRVVNAETGNVRQEREFDNLVTDIGLEYWAKGWPSTNFDCAVGVGTNEPDTSNTTLGQQIARTELSTAGRTVNGAPYYSRVQKLSGRFGAGAIANTISEIGILQRTQSILWCRQLILDEQGQPSTITVLPNEYLDVTYTLYIYPNLEDKAFSFVMDGVTYNCVSRLALGARAASSNYVWNIIRVQGRNVRATQTLGGVDSEPSGTSVAFSTISTTLPWDSNTPYSRSCSLTLDLNVGNIAGGIGTMTINEYNGLFFHQISFDPVLPKDNTVKMTLIFSDTVSRYSAP